MRYPKFLQKNGTIGFVAPSFGCATQPYLGAFQNSLKMWEKEGYKTILGENCYAAEGIGISNTPQSCGKEFEKAYLNPKIDAIISCGGGELMCTILDYIDFEKLKEAQPKWFQGYSDNTNLTFLLATLCDTASIYGPCAGAFGMEPLHASLEDAKSLLEGKRNSFCNYPLWEQESGKTEENPLEPYNTTEPFSMKTNREGEIKLSGRLLGGCMDCLVNLVGTKYDKVSEFCDTYKEDGIIWFMESCDLNPMAICRAMWQMEHAGWFKNVKGFLIGRPYCGSEDIMGMDVYKAVEAVAKPKNIPVIWDIDLGHRPPMIPLVTGSYASILAKEKTFEISMEWK